MPARVSGVSFWKGFTFGGCVKKKKDLVNETTSDLPGLRGLSETFLRKFRNISFILGLVPIGVLYLVCLGVSLSPGIYIFGWASEYVAGLSLWQQSIAYGFAIAAGYIAYIFCLILVVPLVNFLMPFRLKPARGNWYSLHSIPWYYHNALVQLVRYTVLDLVTPTPINMMFFRMMGMKMGKGCIVNTSNISDPALIELGDFVTIGGSATLFAHYGMDGYLIIDKLKIGSHTTIGLKASVMGNVEIGSHCTVGPHVVLLPKTRLADGEKVLK